MASRNHIHHRGSRSALAGLAMVAATMLLGFTQTARADTNGSKYFTAMDHRTKGEWGGGYFVTAGSEHYVSGTIRDKAQAVASGSLFAFGRWNSQPLLTVAVVAERTYTGAKTLRLHADTLGHTIVDRSGSTIADVALPPVGIGGAKNFQVGAATFNASGFVGGVMGVRGVQPILGTDVVGMTATPYASVGMQAKVRIDVGVGGYRAEGSLILADISTPSTAFLNTSNRLWYANSKLTIGLMKGTILAKGWVIAELFGVDFINVTTPWLFTKTWPLASASGYL